MARVSVCRRDLYNESGGLDAQAMLLELPRVSITPSGIGHYGWIRSSNPTLSAQLPGDLIALTAGGLSRIPNAGPLVSVFLDILRYLIEAERSVTPSPTSVSTVSVSSLDVHGIRRPEAIQRRMVNKVGELLPHEPSTWGCNIQPTEDGGWTASPGSSIRAYAGVQNAEDYLERLANQIAPGDSPPPHLTVPLSTRPFRPAQTRKYEWDYFISYASEDKDSIARPLYNALTDRGYQVWFDEAELGVGDRLLTSLDHGLRNCNQGVVILSQAFFGKNWPTLELEGLVQRLMSGEERVLLPVWHGVTAEDVRSYHVSLAGIVAVETTDGMERVVDSLIRSTRRQR